MLTEEMALHPMPGSQNQLEQDHSMAKNKCEPALEYGKTYFEPHGYWGKKKDLAA